MSGQPLIAGENRRHVSGGGFSVASGCGLMAQRGCGGADMTKKVALFGGTFDPVHIGHLVCARRVAESGGFDRIILIPAAQPPHKGTALASAEDRLNMLRLAVEGDVSFEICDIELHRTGPSYTFDTLVEMRDKFGPDVSLHWLIGADMLEQLHMWHRAADVVQMAEIVTMIRPPWQQRLSQILEALLGRADAAAGHLLDRDTRPRPPGPVHPIPRPRGRVRLHRETQAVSRRQ